MTYILGLLIDGTHKERKKSCRWWKCFGWDCIPIFLSLQKALPAVANRKTECPFQTGFGITIGDIGENNRRYFQNIRTFSVNAYVFSAKCLLLFAKSQAFRARKPVFSASKVSIWLFFFSPGVGNGQGLCYEKQIFTFFLYCYSMNGCHPVGLFRVDSRICLPERRLAGQEYWWFCRRDRPETLGR